MSDRAAFLAAIAAAPADDVPRLVFADWLAEHGEPERAEFVRVQCELSRIIAAPAFRKLADTLRHQLGRTTDAVISHGIESRDDVAALRRRERALLTDYWGRWTPDPIRPGACLNLWTPPAGVPHPWVAVLFRRGFVAEVTCPADDWCRAAAAVLAENPPPHVALTAAATLATFDWDARDRRYRVGDNDWHHEAEVYRAGGPADPTWLALFRLTWPGVTFDPPSRGPAAATGPRLTAR